MNGRNELYHHGIMGQKWGQRNGPPYPLSGGQYSVSERRKPHFRIAGGKDPYSKYNKKHGDTVLSKDKTTLQTLSFAKDRTKNVDMFYATHTKRDNAQYMSMFNRPVKKDIVDENGKAIGSDKCYKFKIRNNIKSDLKVAGEDSGTEIFKDLYKNDRDFYNFVNDRNRMQSYFAEDRYKFKGYRDGRKSLEKSRTRMPNENDMTKMYRLFNYVIPYDGQGDNRKAHDMEVQRAKFFKKAKEKGYGALLDTNDAIYGGFKAQSPVIVFDMKQVVPKDVLNTNANDKRIAKLSYTARKALGV